MESAVLWQAVCRSWKNIGDQLDPTYHDVDPNRRKPDWWLGIPAWKYLQKEEAARQMAEGKVRQEKGEARPSDEPPTSTGGDNLQATSASESSKRKRSSAASIVSVSHSSRSGKALTESGHLESAIEPPAPRRQKGDHASPPSPITTITPFKDSRTAPALGMQALDRDYSGNNGDDSDGESNRACSVPASQTPWTVQVCYPSDT
jgi:hypothetical protein